MSDILGEIEDLMIIFRQKYGEFGLIISGDFNARVAEGGDLNNFSIETTFNSNRNSFDKMVDPRGKCLLDFVNNNDLIILNGRSRGDKMGKFTHISTNGNSVIDYCICNIEALLMITDFQVKQIETGSDHFPLFTGIAKPKPRIDNFSNCLPSYTWNNSIKDKFVSIMMFS